jgi:hypothetical protein
MDVKELVMTRILLCVLLFPAMTLAAAATQPTTVASTQPANTHEKLAVEMITFINGLNKTLQSVTDEASAKAAVPKLVEAKKTTDKLKKATEEAGQPSQDVIEKLMSKYGAQLKVSFDGTVGNLQRIGQDPKVMAILEKPLKDLEVFQATREER